MMSLSISNEDLHLLRIPNVQFPDLYVAKTALAADICRRNGLPYIKWKGSDEELVKLVMLPVLVKMFPHIDWGKVLNINIKKKKPMVISGYCAEGNDGSKVEEKHESLDSYVGNIGAHVNIEVLEDLGLLPSFLSDIVTNIKLNYMDYVYRDGYNKKLANAMGSYVASEQAPNLIILDVSYSIPFGIAATMLSLIETLREKANADLIVTAATSYFWGLDEELPDPQRLRDICPRGQEQAMFTRIVKYKLAGRHYANVISFGDYDHPCKKMELEGEAISVDHIWHYHVTQPDSTGYAKWMETLCPDAELHFNTEWTNCIKEN